jgi:hypothetical protein
VTPERNAESSHAHLPVEGADAPSLDQFLILAQKVEELEDRVRSLAVNDLEPLKATVMKNQESIRKMKSPRQWFRAGWRRIRNAIGGK